MHWHVPSTDSCPFEMLVVRSSLAVTPHDHETPSKILADRGYIVDISFEDGRSYISTYPYSRFVIASHRFPSLPSGSKW